MSYHEGARGTLALPAALLQNRASSHFPIMGVTRMALS